MEDGSSRMRPVGTARLSHGLPAGAPMPNPRIFVTTDRAQRGAAGGVCAFFRRHDIR